MNILLIGQPGRFRDGLEAVLAAHPQIQTITCAANISEGLNVGREQQRPLLILLDGNQMSCDNLALIKRKNHPDTHWLFIADTLQQQEAAYASGADAVLLRGFSMASLQTTLSSFVQPIPA